MPLMLDFASFIRHARERKNLSLSQTAVLVGCTKAHLWEMEQRRSDNPTIKTLVGLSNALDEPLSKLAELAAMAHFHRPNRRSRHKKEAARSRAARCPFHP
jgi:transcriptional regulator with XRE-family HTH domain